MGDEEYVQNFGEETSWETEEFENLTLLWLLCTRGGWNSLRIVSSAWLWYSLRLASCTTASLPPYNGARLCAVNCLLLFSVLVGLSNAWTRWVLQNILKILKWSNVLNFDVLDHTRWGNLDLIQINALHNGSWCIEYAEGHRQTDNRQFHFMKWFWKLAIECWVFSERRCLNTHSMVVTGGRNWCGQRNRELRVTSLCFHITDASMLLQRISAVRILQCTAVRPSRSVKLANLLLGPQLLGEFPAVYAVSPVANMNLVHTL
jgi:hypothetical protein